jgi:hypothetical protein
MRESVVAQLRECVPKRRRDRSRQVLRATELNDAERRDVAEAFLEVESFGANLPDE